MSLIKIELELTTRDAGDANVRTTLEWEGTPATIREATKSRGISVPK
jgi:hypothetical protein